MQDEYTDETILKRMLNKVSDSIDKREGSIIYDTLSPFANELVKFYFELVNKIDLLFADTAVDEYLDRLCNQIGVKRKQATFAIKQGGFYNVDNELMDISIGSRFTCEDLYWIVKAKISTGVYQVQCETAGIIGNSATGSMVPVDYIDNLGTATLTDLLIPGADTETDEALRERYFETSNNPAFGGNIEDYKQKTKAIEGVGAVKVIPVWNGGGTVKLIITDSNYNIASEVLVEKVQNIICPEVSDKGLGLAPIGHKVTVVTPETQEINISTRITLASGTVLSNVQGLIQETISNYLLELRKNWEDSESLIVRIAQIEARILDIEGVLDIAETNINEQTSNIEISQEYLPVLRNLEVQENETN